MLVKNATEQLSFDAAPKDGHSCSILLWSTHGNPTAGCVYMYSVTIFTELDPRTLQQCDGTISKHTVITKPFFVFFWYNNITVDLSLIHEMSR